MRIEPSLPAASVPSMPSPSNSEMSYADYVAQLYPAQPYRTRDEINAEDMELQSFKEELGTKGALRFFAEFNLEKIEKLVEEYRKKLEDFAAENPDTPLDIDDMVNDYRKQLIEQYLSAEDDKKAQIVNPERAVSEVILQMKNSERMPASDEKSLLGELLQEKGETEESNTLLI